jgi:hypothetical protein
MLVIFFIVPLYVKTPPPAMTTYDFNVTNLSASLIQSGSLLLPNVDGAPNSVVQSNGSGTLSLVTNNYVTGPASSTATQLATFSGTTGKVIQNSAATLSNAGVASFTGLVNGALTYPAADSTSGYVLATNGAGVLSFVNPSTQGMASTLGEVITSYTSDTSTNDHIKFAVSAYQIGTDISLDTTTAYTKVANVASLGRLTLSGGKKYLFTFVIQNLVFNTHLGGMTLQLFNSDTTTAIGNPYEYIGDGAIKPNTSTPMFFAYYAPTALPATTRVELRITAQSQLVSIGHAQVMARVIG